MRILSIFYSGFILLLLACGTTQVPKQVSYLGYSVSPKIKSDTALINLLQPYSIEVNRTMNNVIGFTPSTMTKRLPESGLGNFMADCMKEMASQKFGLPVDIAFMNQGGIRASINKGNITVGNVYELMPFDNLLVIQELKGAVIEALMNHIASDGGWPISKGSSFKIKNKQAVDIMINGKPLDRNATYITANSDYLAQGGSDAAMLKPFPFQNKGYLIRDGLIEYIKQITASGKPVDAKIENRVTSSNNE
jgi:2',3'-cyclic-nucleotide 2'-phosphodiesterase (5'-nucleotidase family)